ncbi:fimbrial protein [Escherichia coli]
MVKANIISFLFFTGITSVHAETIVQRTIFNADIVASSCHVTVDVDGTGSNRLTFGTFNKSTAAPVSSRDFSVRLYETGATVQGCSAFSAGQLATLQFGNPGQLDTAGVITHGAGDGVRIDVRALDSLADYRGRINIADAKVNYPTDFAVKGEFRFRAKPVIPADVKSGEYTGALTFVVSYQ